MALVLASASPRRRELLALLGVPFDVVAARLDEGVVADPSREKARAASAPGRTVVAADTRIDLDGEWLGKPANDGEAVAMLLRLSGRTHHVVTDVTVARSPGEARTFRVTSRVTMRAFDRDAAAAYVATGEPREAAGAYMAQRRGGALVESVEGCYANVVGFPLCHVYEALGASAPELPETACQGHFDFACPVWRLARAQGREGRDGAAFTSWHAGEEGRHRVRPRSPSTPPR